MEIVTLPRFDYWTPEAKKLFRSRLRTWPGAPLELARRCVETCAYLDGTEQITTTEVRHGLRVYNALGSEGTQTLPGVHIDMTEPYRVHRYVEVDTNELEAGQYDFGLSEIGEHQW